MQIYLYAKSGHSVDLDATRRCAALASFLKGFEPIFCTNDRKVGTYAKKYLGIKKVVNIDGLSNLLNIIQRGDILIYESDEATPVVEKQLRELCSALYTIGRDLPKNIINTSLFTPQKNTKKNKAFFFGDDDSHNLLLNLCHNSSKCDLPLLRGDYFFLDNEKKLAPFFSLVLEEEEYIQTIQNTKYLLSGSINACLESLYCGNSPVFYKRADKNYLDMDFIEKLDIPIISSASLDEIIKEFESIIKSYPIVNDFEYVDLSFMQNEIQDILNQNDTFVRK